MPLKTKAKIASIGEALGKKSSEFTFIDPPLIEAPFSEIDDLNGSTRKLPDPSKYFRAVMGTERILLKDINRVFEEKGPNGEIVYTNQDQDPRVRAYGVVERTSNTSGTSVRQDTSEGVGVFEITFYGTGLNVLGAAGGQRTYLVTVDGGIETDQSYTDSSIFNNRNVSPFRRNVVASGLTPGIHTVKIRNTGSDPFDTFTHGFEIVNDSTQLNILEGAIFSSGNKFVNDSLTSISYNSDFDGSPTLNGKGGNVVAYTTPSGNIKKVINQTDDNALYLNSADHSNEEVIHIMNYKIFGANLSDDFSTLTTSALDRGFTLDDGSTTLVGDNARSVTDNSAELYLNVQSGGAWTLTFTGTGLDVRTAHSTGTIDPYDLIVDGVNVGGVPTTSPVGALNPFIQTLCSGLPYGTHTITIDRLAFSLGSFDVADFIVYGPKKPDIPENAQEISQYFLVADFDGSNTTSTTYGEMPQGAIFKSVVRETTLNGTWSLSGGLPMNIGKTTALSGSVGAYVEFSFFGSDFLIHADDTDQVGIADITIDGVAAAGGVPRHGVVNNGGGNYTFQNLTGNPTPLRLEFNGIALGWHTVRITIAPGSQNIEFVGYSYHTPVHFPNLKKGSMSLSPGAQLQQATDTSGLDLGSAKAWIVYNQQLNEIKVSHNISAVLDSGQGNSTIFFEKAFKRIPVAACMTTGSTSSTIYSNLVLSNISNNSGNITDQYTHAVRVQNKLQSGGTTSLSDSDNICVVFFGELVDEGEE